MTTYTHVVSVSSMQEERRVVIRIPERQHRELKALAALQDRYLRELVEEALVNYLKKHGKVLAK